MERLPDKSIIVEIDGKEYKALPPETVRQIQKDEGELRLLRDYNVSLNNDYTAYKLESKRKIAELENNRNLSLSSMTTQRDFYLSEYNKELALRTKYEHILKGCTGKVVFFRICVR